MAASITVRAVEHDEIIVMGESDPVVGNAGEVLLEIRGRRTAYRFIITAEDAREAGKALIRAGWTALIKHKGATGALLHALAQERNPK